MAGKRKSIPGGDLIKWSGVDLFGVEEERGRSNR
jgi:hypothetical protein